MGAQKNEGERLDVQVTELVQESAAVDFTQFESLVLEMQNLMHVGGIRF